MFIFKTPQSDVLYRLRSNSLFTSGQISGEKYPCSALARFWRNEIKHLVRRTLNTRRLILSDREYNCFISSTVSNYITCLAREDHVTSSILYHVIAEFTFFGLNSCEFETRHHLRLSDEEIWILNRRVKDWRDSDFIPKFCKNSNFDFFFAHLVVSKIELVQ